MLQKNAFGQKIFKIHAWVQKCHFGEIEKLPNPGFIQEKVQKGDFLKKKLAGIEKLFLF